MQFSRIDSRSRNYLSGYAVSGTTKAGLKASGLDRRTVNRWKESDMFGFRARFDEAQQAFRDSLESIAVDLVKQLKPGQTPLLLITLLNANLPDKYRPNVVVADDSAKRTLDAITEATKHSQKAAEENSGRSLTAQIDELLVRRST